MKKWLWLAIIASMIVTSFGLFKRVQVEWNYDTYEVAVPFDEVQALIHEGLDSHSALSKLKKAGVNSVSVGPESIESLEDKGEILLLERDEFYRYALLSDKSIDTLPDKDGVYIRILDSNFPIKESINKVFGENVETLDVDGQSFIYIQGNIDSIEETYLGYTKDYLDLLKSEGISAILHVPVDDINKRNKFIWDEALTLSKSTDEMLFYGDEVLGYPDSYDKWVSKLLENDQSILSIENHGQKGFETLATKNDLNVIRLRSFDLDAQDPDETKDEAIRAVKERNIRSLYFHLITGDDPEKVLKKNVTFFKSLTANMPNHFELGDPKPIQDLPEPFWRLAAALIGSSAFVMLGVRSLLNRRFAILSGAGMGLLSILYVVSGIDLVLKLLALAVAVTAPIFGSLVIRGISNKKDMLLQYLSAILVCGIGIWFGVSLLYGTEYLAHVNPGFRGVKVVYIFPIMFAVLFAMYHALRREKLRIDTAKTALNSPVRYWHVILIGMFGAVLIYYISRTGNSGSVSSIELMMRQKLEDLLYVRPRTKEFLIGFPFYVLALYCFKENFKKIAYTCLVPGIIGWLSFVNTFTHLHIPLHISVLRSAYSLSIGFVIGLIFIIVFNVIKSNYLKWRARW